jgi:hypothetical protein
MSGCIVFSENRAWSKAGWAYRAALDGICEALARLGGGEELLRELRDEEGGPRAMQYLPVQDWSPEDQQLFRRAVQEACRDLRAHGPEDWGDPEFFPGFLKTLDELEALAAGEEVGSLDPRPE